MSHEATSIMNPFMRPSAAGDYFLHPRCRYDLLRNIIHFFILYLILASMGGCVSQSGVQGRYAAQQELCRSAIVSNLPHTESAVDDISTAGAQFSDCMNKAGWRVSSPKAGQVASGAAPNQPTGSPSTNPSAALSAPAPKPVNTPISSPPVVASKPESAVTTSAPPATYQPARPASAPTSPVYGQGAGRQF